VHLARGRNLDSWPEAFLGMVVGVSLVALAGCADLGDQSRIGARLSSPAPSLFHTLAFLRRHRRERRHSLMYLISAAVWASNFGFIMLMKAKKLFERLLTLFAEILINWHNQPRCLLLAPVSDRPKESMSASCQPRIVNTGQCASATTRCAVAPK